MMDDRSNTKKSVLSKRQRSVLRASSTLGTTREQGSGCAGAVVPVSPGAEEFWWHLSLMMFSMCACSPGVGQTAGSTVALSSKGCHHHCQQAWYFSLGDRSATALSPDRGSVV